MAPETDADEGEEAEVDGCAGSDLCGWLDGTVYVDLRGLGDVDNIEDATRLIAAGERCFIGVEVRRGVRRRLRRYLEDAGIECAAFVLAERRPRK